jgi:hypothetical protein
MDRLPPNTRHLYESDFNLADDGFFAGRVETHAKNRSKHWTYWCSYVEPLGVDPLLKYSSYTERCRVLSGFAARVRSGYYGRKRQVKARTVATALRAIGQTIALECERNPLKLLGSDKLIPRLQQMIDGWEKADPPTQKMLPVEADVPEYLATLGRMRDATELTASIGDLALIAFYYLLRIGEYTCKSTRENTKQTVQFKFEDITFFKRNLRGELRCLPRDAPDLLISQADGATLKLDNQKNGWKGVCVFQENNGDPYLCPVRAIGRRYLHLRHHAAGQKEVLSSYWSSNGEKGSVTAEHMSKAIKLAAGMLQYPSTKGIPIQRINTHSLRSGGANALALSGYSDTQIQKMGRWRSTTFREYIREELACFSKGMSRKMKQKFNFVNIAGNAFHDITDELVLQEYTVFATAA